MKTRDELISQAGTIIQSGNKILDTETAPGKFNPEVSDLQFHEFRILALSYLSRVFGPTHSHYQSFKTEVTHATASRTRRGLGILNAAVKELSGDWLETTWGGITKGVLTSMLFQAESQLEQKNFKAAVIICGAVLETLLRNLCLAAGIKIDNELQGKKVAKKPLQLTGEAYKKKVYDRQQNKSIIGWLELYGHAAENKDEEVTPAKVKKILKGVRGLLSTASL